MVAQGVRAHSTLAQAACALLAAAIPLWLLLIRAPSLAQTLHFAAVAAVSAGHEQLLPPLLARCGRIVQQSGFWDIMMASFAASSIASVIATAACGSLGVTMQAFLPRWTRIGARSGVTQLVSTESILRGAFSGLGVVLVAALLLPQLVRELERLAIVPDAFAQAVTMLHAAQHIWSLACAALVCLAAVDVVVQRRQQSARIRMTPREVRDERLQTEGRPESKQRRRAVAVKRARGLRIAAIRRATAVIANPSHVAVALRYAPPAVDVPTVVARGADRMAQVLKETARGFEVPVIEAPALARDIYERSDIDEPIPEECYAAVALVFTWILRVHGHLRRGDEDDA
jgi:flagellar biosynthetic protein FlhB